MRILHIVPFLWSGAGSVVTRLCLSQNEAHTVGIVTSGRSKGFSDWSTYRRQLKRNGVSHFAVDLFDRDPVILSDSVRKLRGVIEEFRPDVVHCHSGVPAYASALVRQTAGFQFLLIGQFHSWGLGRPDWMNAMDLWAFGQCDRVLCGARAYERVLRDGGVPEDRIVYQPWGLPLARWRQTTQLERANRLSVVSRRLSAPILEDARGQPTTDNRQPILLGFVGRIEPRKCQLELVESFAQLAEKLSAARLDLIGPVADEVYASRIRAFIREHNLSDAVCMPGRVRDVYRRTSDWDLFVSLSSDEGQGLAILEAMALGVPVIARRVAGVEDYLSHGVNGIALDSASPAKVAEAVLWALGNPERMRRMANDARAMVDRNYNWDATVRGMERVYESCGVVFQQ